MKWEDDFKSYLKMLELTKPVEAPLGTIKHPFDLSSNSTSTSIVGFPLESSISNASIFLILIILSPNLL